jgi:hypothetical protein
MEQTLQYLSTFLVVEEEFLSIIPLNAVDDEGMRKMRTRQNDSLALELEASTPRSFNLRFNLLVIRQVLSSCRRFPDVKRRYGIEQLDKLRSNEVKSEFTVNRSSVLSPTYRAQNIDKPFSVLRPC